LVGGISQPYHREFHLRERIARKISSQKELPKLFHVVRFISLARRGTHKHHYWLIQQPRLSYINRIIFHASRLKYRPIIMHLPMKCPTTPLPGTIGGNIGGLTQKIEPQTGAFDMHVFGICQIPYHFPTLEGG
jgi:hypothetical protein